MIPRSEDYKIPRFMTYDVNPFCVMLQVIPADHPVSSFDFDVIIGADGRRNTLDGTYTGGNPFPRKEFRYGRVQQVPVKKEFSLHVFL